jgi:hypothetical protein
LLKGSRAKYEHESGLVALRDKGRGKRLLESTISVEGTQVRHGLLKLFGTVGFFLDYFTSWSAYVETSTLDAVWFSPWSL